MYERFYGLRERPFGSTSDPNFLFLSRRHKEALSYLVYGIQQRKGFIEITGEIGTGKTTVCRALLKQLDPTTKTAMVFNPDLSGLQLLQLIVEDLGIPTRGLPKVDVMKALSTFLLEQLAKGCNVVVLIDEAQNIKAPVMEQLRLLSNLETDKEKLFQFVLVGQPELRDKLKDPSLRQLRQRISVRYHITPLDADEILPYIEHRLAVAGAVGTAAFDEQALQEIRQYSGGVPRLINALCDKLLLAGFVLGQRALTGQMAQRCIAELEGAVLV